MHVKGLMTIDGPLSVANFRLKNVSIMGLSLIYSEKLAGSFFHVKKVTPPLQPTPICLHNTIVLCVGRVKQKSRGRKAHVRGNILYINLKYSSKA